MIATYTLFFVVLLLTLDWVRVARLYGGSTIAAFRLMLWTLCETQGGPSILFHGVMTVAATLYLTTTPAFRESVPTAIRGALIAVPVAALMIRLRPPAVLFLGSSRYGQGLFQSVRLRANFFRVISFLAPPADLVGRQAFMMDGFRTQTSNWSPIVRRIAEAVPLLVVDARDVTPQVVEEIGWLTEPRMRERVLFVSTDGGKLPALDALGTAVVERAKLHVTVERICAHAIRTRLRAIERAPRIAAPSRLDSEIGRPSHPWGFGGVLGELALGGYGAAVGLLIGHFYSALFLTTSPVSFIARVSRSRAELSASLGAAFMGAVILVWFGAHAHRGDLGFRAAPYRHPWAFAPKRGGAMSLGLTYGAGAGALLSTLMFLAVSFTLMTEPTMASSPWATAPYGALLFELTMGMSSGGLTGGLLGSLLWKGKSLTPVRFEVLGHEAIDVSWKRFIALGAGFGAAMFGLGTLALWQLVGPPLSAPLIAASAGSLYFLCLAAFMRQLFVAFLCAELSDPTYTTLKDRVAAGSQGKDRLLEEFFAALDRSRARVSTWATAGGMICGGAIGLRLGIYAVAARLDATGHSIALMMLIGGAVGAYLGSGIAQLGPRLKTPQAQ